MKPLASLWPSRKTLKNDVKLVDPIDQEDDEDDVDWLAIPIKKDEDEDLRMPRKDLNLVSKKVFNIDDEPVGIHKKGFGQQMFDEQPE